MLFHQHFGVNPCCNIMFKDPSEDFVGWGHEHKNIVLRTCFGLLKLSYKLGTQKEVSQILFKKFMTVEEYKKNAPQFTGDEARELARNYPQLLNCLGGSNEVKNSLSAYFLSLDTVAWLLFEDDDTDSETLWWELRKFYALFVGLFGKAMVVPSLVELCLTGPLYAEKLGEIAAMSGINLKPKHFTEWSFEQRNSRANKDLKETNSKSESRETPARKNHPDEEGHRAVQMVRKFDLYLFS